MASELTLNGDYPRRPGSDEQGRDYEISMTALLSLRCALQADTKEMWVGSNIDQVGDFDDIVLHKTTPDGTSVAYLIQLKHQENPTNITRSDLNYVSKETMSDDGGGGGRPRRQKSKADFSLYKYSKGFSELIDRLSKPPSSDEFPIIDCLRLTDYLNFILYTNKGADVYDFFEKSTTGPEFLNTSTHPEHSFQFNQTKLDHNSDFLKRLYLFVNQAHVTEVESIIENELRKSLSIANPVKIDLKKITRKFTTFFRTWIKDKGTKVGQKYLQTCYTLTKSDIIRKLTDLLLDEYKIEMTKEPYVYYDPNCVRKSIWNRLVNTKTVTLVESDTFVLEFLKKYVGSELRHYYAETTRKTWTENLKGKFQTKLYKQNELLRRDLHKIVGTRGKISLYDIWKCLWYRGNVPFLLEITREKELDEILKVLSLSASRLPVLVLTKLHFEGKCSENVFRNFNDIAQEFRSALLERSVQFQGRSTVQLKDLIVNESLYELVTSKDIIAIINDQFNLGNGQKPLPKNFIKRTLLLDRREVDVSEAITQEAAAHIVSAVPGMGKTVLLESLVYELPPTLWVLKINLNEHEDYYEKVKSETRVTAVDHLRYFNSKQNENDENCNNPELSDAVFLEMLGRNRVIVLLDGFDEVSVSDRETVSDIIKSLYNNRYRMWVTTRPIMRQHLKRTINATAYTIRPFSKQDQASFLTKYFETVNCSANSSANTERDSRIIQRFVHELLDAATTNLKDNDSEFTGIPLQTKLLADVFSGECSRALQTGQVAFDHNFDLLYLYEAFVKKKTDILCERFGRGAKDMRIFFEEHQQMFALKILFDEKSLADLDIEQKLEDYYNDEQKRVHFLQREGIIVVGQNENAVKRRFYVRFVHRTFAEFLAAEWIVRNMNSDDMKVKNTVRILYGKRFPPLRLHVFLFNILDRMLAKDRVEHSRVIAGNLDRVVLERSTDKAGRTLAHMFAMSPEIPVRFLQSLPGDLATDADTFGYNPLDYAINYEHVQLADEFCKKYPTLAITNECRNLKSAVNSVPDYVARGYKDLLRTFVPYLAIEAIALWYLDRDTVLGPLKPYLGFDFYNNLHHAAAFGTGTNVQRLLRDGFEVSSIDRHGNTALHYAVACNNAATALVLLENKADVNREGNYKQTPLHFAAEAGHDHLARILIENGAELDRTNEHNNTPLYLAFDRDKISTVKLLIAAGAKDNVKDKKGCTLIHYTAEYGSEEILGELLARGADVNRTNYYNETPLHLSFRSRSPAIVRLLIENGAKFDKQNNVGEYPLHYAAQTTHSSECLRTFLDRGCETEITEDGGLTPLISAIRRRNNESAQILLEYGANCSACGNDGNSVLHYAAMNGDVELLERLLSKGAQANGLNANGDTPLNFALVTNNIPVARMLLQHGAKNVTNGLGTTTVHAASAHGDEFIVSSLLSDDKTEINQLNRKQCVPLHYAAEKGNVKVVRFLIENGARVDQRNGDGMTALHLAIFDQKARYKKNYEPYKSTVRLLLKNGVDVNAKDSKGNTGLHYTCTDFNPGIEIFLDNGVVENIADFYTEVIRTLLDYGANVNIKNNEGKMPVDLAVDQNVIALLTN